VFTPVLAKHTKRLSLVDLLSIGVDRIQRNFEPIKQQVAIWKASRITDDVAKLVIYRAFVEDELDAPKHLVRRVHDLYFSPQIEEFAPRTTWSLSNAFTSAFKGLDPVPQLKATARLGPFLEMATSQPATIEPQLTNGIFGLRATMHADRSRPSPFESLRPRRLATWKTEMDGTSQQHFNANRGFEIPGPYDPVERIFGIGWTGSEA
jgi:hypothetical protein